MKVFVFVLIIFFIPNINTCTATEAFNVQEFISEIKSYNNEMFPEFSDEKWISKVLTR